MSRFLILATTLTLAIILIGVGLGWYIYQNLLQDVVPLEKKPPQTASVKTVIEIYKEKEEKPSVNIKNNAFQEIPQEQ